MTGLIGAMAAAAVPLTLAALGGLISERAGVLNIALEGCIGAGAFTAALLLRLGLPLSAALVGALAAGALFGGLLAAVHLRLGANLFIAGLGVNLLIPALTGLTSQAIWGHKGIVAIEAPAVGMVRWLMPLAAILTAVMMTRSGYGRRLRAAGSSPAFLTERGVSVTRVRASALLLSSGAAALAGAFLSLRIDAWVPGMSSGRGWIALVIIWLGFRRPMGVLIASYLFALTEIISGQAQGRWNAPASLLLALPYLVALVALTAATIAGRWERK